MFRPEIKKVHFIGLGGIGVSALARYCLARGWEVSGSDIAPSPLLKTLKKEGVRVFVGHKTKHVQNPDLVIYTVIIPPENPERQAAEKKKIRTLSYAEALGELSKKYFTVAVTGSHGKSTTTAMLASIMVRAGLDPTVIVGANFGEFGQKNFRPGNGRYLVVEADDFNRSFRYLSPALAVVTSIDREHLDVYKNYAGVLDGFKKFVEKIPPQGFLVANAADRGVIRVARNSAAKVVWYNRKNSVKPALNIPGLHNRENAEAAATAARLLDIKKEVIGASLSSYRGLRRRMEIISPIRHKDTSSGNLIITDYAHHPTEISATLSALREAYPKKKIIAVFQPHQQDRLNRLFDEFGSSLQMADGTAFLPVYRVRGREVPAQKTSFQLFQKFKKEFGSTFYLKDFSRIPAFLRRFSSCQRHVFVFLSAGNLDNWLRRYFGMS